MPAPEPALLPDLPIVDSHHHLFDKAPAPLAAVMGCERFLLDEYTAFADDGHNVVASVIVEGLGMDRVTGPEDERSVAATQFLAGQAAMAETGRYRGVQVGAGIVGATDLRGGDRVRPVLEAHLVAAAGLLRGIRQGAVWDADGSIGAPFGNPPNLYLDPGFQAGFAQLAQLGLSFDAFIVSPQLPDVTGLARAFPDTRIVLDHLGNPVGIGVHHGRLAEEFPAWRRDMAELARCPNVVVKMGGLGTYMSGWPSFRASPPARSAQLADEWRPYAVETIELFGAHRVMFESNLPTDQVGTFSAIGNAFKSICAGASDDELRMIFAGTAQDFYRLEVDLARLTPARLTR